MPPSQYHHGDLRGTLLRAGMELLPLLSAIATVGYRDLAAEMTAARPAPATVDEFVEVGVAYVEFALRRPAL